MAESNPIINPVTGRQWDLNSLIEKLLGAQESLLEAQEKNITLTAQARELERMVRDADDLKSELANQGQLISDKSKENKHLHQELSRMSGILENKIQEVDDFKSIISDLQHQLKTCQSERDLLAIMLTEAENAARKSPQSSESSAAAAKDTQQSTWLKYLKGKQA